MNEAQTIRILFPDATGARIKNLLPALAEIDLRYALQPTPPSCVICALRGKSEPAFFRHDAEGGRRIDVCEHHARRALTWAFAVQLTQQAA
jgi:hypothetical protein